MHCEMVVESIIRTIDGEIEAYNGELRGKSGKGEVYEQAWVDCLKYVKEHLLKPIRELEANRYSFTRPVPKRPAGLLTSRCGRKYKLEIYELCSHLDYLRDKELVLSAEGDATRDPFYLCSTASWFYIFSKEDNPDLDHDVILASGVGEPIRKLIPVEE